MGPVRERARFFAGLCEPSPNAIENLAVFAPAVLTAALIGVSTPATILAAESLRIRSGERSLRAESKLAPVESLKTASHSELVPRHKRHSFAPQSERRSLTS